MKPKEQLPVGARAQDTNSVKARDTDAAASLAKNEVPEPVTRPAPTQSQQREKAPASAAGEQLALLRRPVEPVIERAPVARPAPRPLQGFIIQVAFQDKQKAQSWAEKMTQRGYAVSVTEAGPEGSLRVRLGNFAVRDEAERQLQAFRQEGMSGIIINLPQAFRPEAVSSIP
jgi:DedD protein